MRLIDLDKFLEDLRNEGCDVCKTDSVCSLYSEFGYSYDLVERVAERQNLVDAVKVVTDTIYGKPSLKQMEIEAGLAGEPKEIPYDEPAPTEYVDYSGFV